MALLLVLAILICGNAVDGQFQRMFQQNIVDNPPDTGKILIQSELKTETLVSEGVAAEWSARNLHHTRKIKKCMIISTKLMGKVVQVSVFMIYTSIYTILFLQEMPEDCAKKAISGDTLVLDYEVQLFIL